MIWGMYQHTRGEVLTVVQETFRERLRLPTSIARLSIGFSGSIIWNVRYTQCKETFASRRGRTHRSCNVMPRPSNTSSWSPHHVAHWRFLLGATLVVFHAVFAQPLLQQRMLEAARQRKIARFERKRGSRVFTDIGRKAIAQVRNEARAMLEGRLSMEKADELAKEHGPAITQSRRPRQRL
jgi:hypothetical protein